MVLKNLVDQFDKAYSIPSPIVITGSKKPTDVRQVCDTVADFENFLSTTGMDIRYPGLVTYEKANNRFLGYKEVSEGNCEWVELEGTSTTDGLEDRIKELEGRINSMYLEFEEQHSLQFE